MRFQTCAFVVVMEVEYEPSRKYCERSRTFQAWSSCFGSHTPGSEMSPTSDVWFTAYVIDAWTDSIVELSSGFSHQLSRGRVTIHWRCAANEQVAQSWKWRGIGKYTIMFILPECSCSIRCAICMWVATAAAARSLRINDVNKSIHYAMIRYFLDAIFSTTNPKIWKTKFPFLCLSSTGKP